MFAAKELGVKTRLAILVLGCIIPTAMVAGLLLADFYTGQAELPTIMDSVNTGALDRFYTKPWDNRELRENVRSAFHQYRQAHGLAA